MAWKVRKYMRWILQKCIICLLTKQKKREGQDRKLIKGVVCGIRVEDIQEPLMQEIRYLDKLVDELARGKAMDKILRR